jgi:hypothetical protein
MRTYGASDRYWLRNTNGRNVVMIASFKFVKTIKFMLNSKTFENVYYDRFNSIFKGFYLVGNEELIKKRILYKIPSPECFGPQDVEYIEKMDKSKLIKQQQITISRLNTGFKNNEFKIKEGTK